MSLNQFMNQVKTGTPTPYAPPPDLAKFGVGNLSTPWNEMDPSEQAGFYSNPAFGNLDNYGTSPYTSALQSFVNGPGVSYTGGTYTAKDMSKTALPQYDAMRTRLNSQYNTTQQQGQDAIDRQFAAMGGGPSGAQVKQTENLTGSIAKQKGEDLDALNAQEAEARTGLQQQEAQKQFQSGEAARGYGFQASLANQSSKLQGLGALSSLDLQYKNAQKEAMNDQFNKLMAQYQTRHSGGLLGGGGFLGTGIGA